MAAVGCAGKVDPLARRVRVVPALEGDPRPVGRPCPWAEIERLIGKGYQAFVSAVGIDDAGGDSPAVRRRRRDQDVPTVGRPAGVGCRPEPGDAPLVTAVDARGEQGLPRLPEPPSGPGEKDLAG